MIPDASMCNIASLDCRATRPQCSRTLDWLRERRAGCTRAPPPAGRAWRDVRVEATLAGHASCVNCLDWSASGARLASGSDDGLAIVWDVARARQLARVHTRHTHNIFSVKFVPHTNDSRLATCAGDGHVRVFDTCRGDAMLVNCVTCNLGRAKQVATHAGEPTMLWSASECGRVQQYDSREPHVCNARRPLIDLNGVDRRLQQQQQSLLQAKCLTLDPTRSHALAVGASDSCVRIYDRRKLCGSRLSAHTICDANCDTLDDDNDSSAAIAAQYIPAHIKTTCERRATTSASCGVTSIAYSRDATQLLVNAHADQVYLFNLVQRHTPNMSSRLASHDDDNARRDTQCATIAQAVVDTCERATATAAARQCCEWRDVCAHLLERLERIEQQQQQQRQQNQRSNATLEKRELDWLNAHIAARKPSSRADRALLLNLRARALSARAWPGDHYAALRDCCDALELICDRTQAAASKRIVELAMSSFLECNIDATLDLMARISSLDNAERFAHGDASRTCAILRTLKRVLRAGARSRAWMQASIDEHLFYKVRQQQCVASNKFVANSTLLPQHQPSLRNAHNALALSSTKSIDYTARYCGHCNLSTDIKQASFFGPREEFVVAGSDDGAFYLWHKSSSNLLTAVNADMHVLNCVAPHPNECMMATSGLASTIKLWSPIGVGRAHHVQSLDVRCSQNQSFLGSDPLDTILTMIFPDYAESDYTRYNNNNNSIDNL